MKKAFITGLTGFAGKHLAKHLLENEFEVSGTYLIEDSVENLEDREKIDENKVSHENQFNRIKSIRHVNSIRVPKYGAGRAVRHCHTGSFS